MFNFNLMRMARCLLNLSKLSVPSVLGVFLLFFVACSPSSKKGGEDNINKIYSSFTPGNTWMDSDSVHINAHGGGFLYYDGKYYWFGEHKSDNTNQALVGINCYSSTDLYNWKKEGVALPVVENDLNSPIATGCVMERPKVIYNPDTEKFVMYFHLELPGEGYTSAYCGVAGSDNVTGPYEFLKAGRVNPKMWPANFTPEQRSSTIQMGDLDSWTPEWIEAVRDGLFVRNDYPDGQMSRDLTVFVDDDGKAYMVYASEENLTLHLAELTDDYLDFTGKYIRIAPCSHSEAPAVFKYDGQYFMIASGCSNNWAPNDARLFVADNIWGPWEQYPNPCVGDNADVTFFSQSTYVLPVEGKENAFIFIADRWNPQRPIDGTYVWLPVEFEDGLPVLRWQDEWDLGVFDVKN